MKTASLVAAFLATFISTIALSQESPYKGEETRPLKALSQNEIEGYLSARGMGFAKVAELNHYPGPRHVIDMASDLDLSDEQLRSAQAAFDAMHASAVEWGTKLVEKERELDALFAAGKADGDNARVLIDEIAAIQGKLRYAHVGAHVAMRSLLTPAQVARYDELRGYAGGHPGH